MTHVWFVASLVFATTINWPIERAHAGDGGFRPNQSTVPTPAPHGAVVLLSEDGKPQFVSMSGDESNWPMKDGFVVSTRGETVPGKKRSNHLVSTFHFRDADIHVEFMLPPDGNGNSGVYLHGHYELQILNSSESTQLTQQEMGALYGFAPPLVNAARKPGRWQVYDVRFIAPRRNKAGEITEKGSLTAWLNGKQVLANVRFGDPVSKYHPYRHGRTPYLAGIESKLKSTSIGPLFLQDHDAPVRFRNVWIKPLDDLAGFLSRTQ